MKVYQLTFRNSHRYMGEPYRELVQKGYPVEHLPEIEAAALIGTPVELLTRSEVMAKGDVRMSMAEVACYLAHLQAWRELWESGEKHALILEDDTAPLVDFDAFKSEVESWGSGWDAVQAEWSTPGSLHNLGFHPKMARAHACGYGAMAYVVSRLGARKMIDPGIVKPADLILMQLSTQGEVYRLKERLFAHDYKSPSTVQCSPFYA